MDHPVVGIYFRYAAGLGHIGIQRHRHPGVQFPENIALDAAPIIKPGHGTERRHRVSGGILNGYQVAGVGLEPTSAVGNDQRRLHPVEHARQFDPERAAVIACSAPILKLGQIEHRREKFGVLHREIRIVSAGGNLFSPFLVEFPLADIADLDRAELETGGGGIVNVKARRLPGEIHPDALRQLFGGKTVFLLIASSRQFLPPVSGSHHAEGAGDGGQAKRGPTPPSGREELRATHTHETGGRAAVGKRARAAVLNGDRHHIGRHTAPIRHQLEVTAVFVPGHAKRDPVAIPVGGQQQVIVRRSLLIVVDTLQGRCLKRIQHCRLLFGEYRPVPLDIDKAIHQQFFHLVFARQHHRIRSRPADGHSATSTQAGEPDTGFHLSGAQRYLSAPGRSPLLHLYRTGGKQKTAEGC
ncbi:hypothetical protein K0F19_10425 [Bacteroides fragilis]|nr:hypothetical protein [Bacteroides fragilis]